MDREIAAEFYGNSQPRHAFSNTNRHQVTSLATHLSQRFNLSIQGLIFDSTIPVDQCREALAAINTSWEPIPNVSAQNGKSLRAYMLRINHTRPKQVFVAVSDFSHKSAGGTGDFDSITHFNIFTHKSKDPCGDKRYANISVITGHTGSFLDGSEIMPERSIESPFFKKPHKFINKKLIHQIILANTVAKPCNRP